MSSLLGNGLRWLADWIDRNNKPRPWFAALPFWAKVLVSLAPALLGGLLLVLFMVVLGNG
jgi:hypothetical protein